MISLEFWSTGSKYMYIVPWSSGAASGFPLEVKGRQDLTCAPVLDLDFLFMMSAIPVTDQALIKIRVQR